MMPRLNGRQVLAALRPSSKTPVLMLTTRDTVQDRVKGLDTAAKAVKNEREYALHRGEVLSRTTLYEHLFDEEESMLSNLLDVHVSNLRKKLGAEATSTASHENLVLIPALAASGVAITVEPFG